MWMCIIIIIIAARLFQIIWHNLCWTIFIDGIFHFCPRHRHRRRRRRRFSSILSFAKSILCCAGKIHVSSPPRAHNTCHLLAALTANDSHLSSVLHPFRPSVALVVFINISSFVRRKCTIFKVSDLKLGRTMNQYDCICIRRACTTTNADICVCVSHIALSRRVRTFQHHEMRSVDARSVTTVVLYYINENIKFRLSPSSSWSSVVFGERNEPIAI